MRAVQRKEGFMWKLCLAVAVAVVPGVGLACAVMSPFQVSDLAGADIVVAGEVTSFETISEPDGTALITVEVDQVLKGATEGEMVFVWNAGMAEGPGPAKAQGRVLLGAMAAGRPVAPSFGDARPDLPRLGQTICSEVWMVPADEPVMADARALLD